MKDYWTSMKYFALTKKKLNDLLYLKKFDLGVTGSPMTTENPKIQVVTTSKPEVPGKPVVTPKPEITTKIHGIAPISTDSPYNVVTGKVNNETVVRKQTESPVGTVAVIAIAVVVGLAVLVVIVSIDAFRNKYWNPHWQVLQNERSPCSVPVLILSCLFCCRLVVSFTENTQRETSRAWILTIQCIGKRQRKLSALIETLPWSHWMPIPWKFDAKEVS